jgi:hypothetical protein
MKRWLEVSILLLQNTHRACRSESKLRRNTLALLAESEKPWYTLKQYTAPAESNQINWNHYESTRGYICTGSDHVMPLNRLASPFLLFLSPSRCLCFELYGHFNHDRIFLGFEQTPITVVKLSKFKFCAQGGTSFVVWQLETSRDLSEKNLRPSSNLNP